MQSVRPHRTHRHNPHRGSSVPLRRLPMTTVRLAIALLSAGALLLAQTEATHTHDRPVISREAEDPNWSALARAMVKMHDEMSATKQTGIADTDFVRLMLPHHQAAIDMARAQLMYGKDPEIRRLAQEIITDQQSEIELMQLWLKRRQLTR
jgi:uncharacterized protein (DUF305 family)